MPRGNKKKKGRRNADSRQPSDEEYDTSDNASVISAVSDTASLASPEGGDEVDELATQEDFEDKLKDCIEGLSQKSAQGRKDCLLGLQSALRKKCIYEFITDRKLTISDSLEKCVKKGKGEEQHAAAISTSLLCLQLGAGDETEEVFHSARPIMSTLIADTTAPVKGRTACCTSLGMLAFLSSGDLEDTLEVMKVLENIFRRSYFKGDGNPPTHSPDITALHTAALNSWCLLLSIAPPSVVQNFIDTHLPKLPEMLESADVDLRIAAGDAIALLYELAREMDEDFEGDDITDLCDLLKKLATDSNKHRAKKDRRQQRSSFRDILRAVEEGDVPAYRVRFGIEAIEIDSWARKRQYDALCQILSTGMNVHLAENELVREIFGLGPPLLSSAPVHKVSKVERHMYNSAAFKARTKARAKSRDKRAVGVHIQQS